MDESPFKNECKQFTVPEKLNLFINSKVQIKPEAVTALFPNHRSPNTSPKSKSKFYVEPNKVASTSSLSVISEEVGIITNCRSSIDSCMIKSKNCILF